MLNSSVRQENNEYLTSSSTKDEENNWIQPSISTLNIPFAQRIIDGIYAVVSASSQSWFWSKEWQEREAQADKDISEGRFTSHSNMDDFLDAPRA